MPPPRLARRLNLFRIGYTSETMDYENECNHAAVALVGSIRRMANGAVAFYVAGGRGGFRRTLRKSYFCFRTPWSNMDDFRF